MADVTAPFKPAHPEDVRRLARMANDKLLGFDDDGNSVAVATRDRITIYDDGQEKTWSWPLLLWGQSRGQPSALFWCAYLLTLGWTSPAGWKDAVGMLAALDDSG